jgi:hypothetical protein
MSANGHVRGVSAVMLVAVGLVLAQLPFQAQAEVSVAGSGPETAVVLFNGSTFQGDLDKVL